MKNKVLITGIAGSGGSYLAEYLLSLGNEIFGLVRWHSTSNKNNLSPIKDKIKLYECDLNDLGNLIRVLQEIQPDIIYNLSAHANVKVAFDSPIAVVQNNINNTLNLLEAVRILFPNNPPIIQHASTSEVYGNMKKDDCPIKESYPLNPANPYSVSKLTQEKLILSYFYSFNIPAIITRSFTYLNPRRTDLFASNFAKQIVEIENGKREVLFHGNLDSVRCLMDVRDMCSAYHMASQKCKFGEPYNIGGNNICSVGDILDKLKMKAKKRIISKLDQNLLRPVDISFQIPDVSKFQNETGWKPQFELDESLEFMLEYFRERL